MCVIILLEGRVLSRSHNWSLSWSSFFCFSEDLIEISSEQVAVSSDSFITFYFKTSADPDRKSQHKSLRRNIVRYIRFDIQNRSAVDKI